MIFEKALVADRRRDFACAIRLYEKSLSRSEASVEACLDLLVLCWQLTDYGYWTTMRVPRRILDKASSLPVMHLFAVSGGNRYRQEALELMACCEAEGTVRAAYIASVIRGVEERRGI